LNNEQKLRNTPLNFGHPFAVSSERGKQRHIMVSYPPIRSLALLVVLGLAANSGRAQSVPSVESGNSLSTFDGRSGSVPGAASQPTAASSQFALGVSDVIRVNVWKNPDLSQTVTIGPDGFVSLPLLGDIHVAGETANQLAQLLTARLSTYVVSAQVTVSVVDIKSRQVYVTGQVGRPGGYPLVAPISVLQLIAQAGGLNTFANRKGILILRGSSGNTQRMNFNYIKAIHGDSKQNISLQPGDTVIVP
jgi:polysaccharide export outer membrane protein